MRTGKRVGVGPPLVLSAVVYLAGLATFLAVHAAALEAVTGVLLAGDVDALLAVLAADGFADPLAFVVRAVERGSVELLYPVGAVALPAVLAVRAWQSGHTSWWLWTGFALGPLAGIVLGAAPISATVGLDLLLFVVFPTVGVVGGVASYGRG